MSKDITIGYEIGTGKEVTISPHHMFISGISGAGKSESMKAIIGRSESKILILDVKRRRDYSEFGADIPLYIEQKMDALMLKDLIESTERLSIKRELPMLSKLCRKSSTWEELLSKARKWQDDKKLRDFYKDVLEVLILIFEKLVREYNTYEFSDRVELDSQINVMNLSHVSRAMQQIIVSSVINHIERHESDIKIVIDEAHRFIPQAASSAASQDVVRLIREGRASNTYLWLADQTVTGVEKDVLKQVHLWILGRQTEINEAKRTLNQIPQRKSLGLRAEDIQTLGIGEFIVATIDWAKKVYMWPRWIDEKMAKEVAMGQMTIQDVIDMEPQRKEVDEEMWKEKYELERKARAKIEEDLEESQTRATVLKERLEKISSPDIDLDKQITKERKEVLELVDSLKKKITNLEKERDELRNLQQKQYALRQSREEDNKKMQKKIDLLEEEMEPFFGLKDALIQVIGNPSSVSTLSKDEIVKEVLQKVSGGITYEIAPLEALKRGWEQRALNTVKAKIDSLNEMELDILGFLLNSGIYHNKADIMRGIYGIDYSVDKAKYERTAKAVDELADIGFLYTSGGKYKADIMDFIKKFIGSRDRNVDKIYDHVIHYIHGKVVGH